MALNTNFNVNPYYDDFDEDKKFLKMLFKPGYAVQARELTQLQTILQKQVERFGNHIFKNGAVVQGGQTFLQDSKYIKLDATYGGTNIVANNFIGQTILSTDESKRGEVIKVYEANPGTGDPATLLIKQLYGDAFTSSETIKTNETSPVFANISTSGTGTGQVFSIDSGIYYYEGYFVKTDAQTIATSKYSTTTANAKIGFEVVESTVKFTSDTSLLDPAQDASNYQAPGSDRYKIELILSTRPLNDNTDTEQFIEIARVENGVLVRDYQYAVYSVLEDTLARRTFDESGNYTVRSFGLSLETPASNTANIDITLSPGKAYVFGYEFETISPTVITVDKPRTTDSIQNKRVSADYGYFVYTNDHFGSFPINSLDTVDLHCVSNSSIGDTTAKIANTKIGTARVKSISYDSSSNTSNSSTYEYKTFLFDVNVDSITGTVTSATPTTITIGNIGSGHYFCNVADAYTGAKLRITSGIGSNESPKIISGWNVSTQTITLDSAFATTPDGSSQFSIDFEFNDVKSFANFSGTTRICAGSVDERSKDFASLYNDTIILDSSSEALVFPLGEEYIAPGTIADFIFDYRKLFTSQAFSSSVSPGLSLGSGESIPTKGTASTDAQNYQVIVTNSGSSPYTVGQTVPANKITAINTSDAKITIENANNMTANIIATINFSKVSGSPAKSKTFVQANNTVQTAGGENIFGNSSILVYASKGQTTIANNMIVTTPDTPQSLYVSDVTEIIQIIDFAGSAVANTGGTDVTGRYALDNGQRDSYYDHAAIKLKPGNNPPIGPLVVRYNLYTSSGSGFFSVDSYPTYGTIPKYTSPVLGTSYELRDCLDFRPVRRNATAAIGGSAVVFDVDSTSTGPKIPENGSNIILDYQYYLPRIDRVVLGKNRNFEVIRGEPSIRPAEPKSKDDSMSLYMLNIPPYVSDTNDIKVNYINNKRYTMRDIGVIEKRIENLEYYTSLSLLEQDAVTKQDLTILDSTNLPRFKNGVVVDAFKGHSVADVTNSDYTASIDTVQKEMRPSFNIWSYMLTFDSANSSGFQKSGPFVTLQSTTSTFVNQPLASKTMNINPFNMVNYIGKIVLNPPSDVWIDTTRKPDVLVNIGGDKDAWDLLLVTPQALRSDGIILEKGGSGYGATAPIVTISGGGGIGATAVAVVSGGVVTDIQIVNPGTGYTSSPNISIAARSGAVPATASYNGQFFKGPFSTEYGSWNNTWTGTDFTSNQYWSGNALIRDTYALESQGQTRNGVVSQVVPQAITKSIGDRVVDVSIVPYMRTRNILFTCSDFEPDKTLYPFFDGSSVEKYVARANRLILENNNLQYNVSTADAETCNVYNNNTATTNGTCITVATSNNSVYVVNINPNSSFVLASANLIGQKTGASNKIIGYEHFSGIANSATANTITLALDASGATNEALYANTSNSQTIFITYGTGSGQQATISSYDATTRTITISGTWTNTPDQTSVYSIGRLRTTRAGVTAGIYTIPPQTFRVGEKLFRLTNTSTGDIPSSSTNGDAKFFAQGLLQTQEESIISTIAPTIQRTSVTDTQVVSSNRLIERAVVGWYDPLAQSFLVSPQNFPEGMFIEKVRVAFQTKDITAPVTLQIRPMVNGYPSATTVYPYGSVTLTPDQVNVTDSPDMDDDAKCTDFVFDTPLYLQPGEHSFVLVSNSRGYNAYVAEMGALDIVQNVKISEQPYGGSFFMSQNGSTWSADQNLDITFRIYRKNFNTATNATLQFNVEAPIANINYDLAQVMTSEVVLAPTNINYSFLSERATGGLTSYKPITKMTDYTMDDGDGRRVLSKARGNTTFTLRAVLSSKDVAVSPFVDITRFASIFVENDINNLPLLNTGFVIAKGGNDYANSSDVTITISGGNGSGATATANVVDGAIDRIIVTNGGSGYTGSPTITVTPGTGGGANGSIIYNGEDKKSGGNSKVRYITRKVTLADGFDSGDLRVYLTGYKPSGSNILVYYKLLSKAESDIFDNKEYQLMTPLGNENFVSTNKQDYRELTFAPGINGAANNSVSYTSGSTSFSTFRTFAIKIVLTGTDTTDVPKVRDLRAIALPRG
jgi:hypothetical protein